MRRWPVEQELEFLMDLHASVSKEISTILKSGDMTNVWEKSSNILAFTMLERCIDASMDLHCRLEQQCGPAAGQSPAGQSSARLLSALESSPRNLASPTKAKQRKVINLCAAKLLTDCQDYATELGHQLHLMSTVFHQDFADEVSEKRTYTELKAAAFKITRIILESVRRLIEGLGDVNAICMVISPIKGALPMPLLHRQYGRCNKNALQFWEFLLNRILFLADVGYDVQPCMLLLQDMMIRTLTCEHQAFRKSTYRFLDTISKNGNDGIIPSEVNETLMQIWPSQGITGSLPLPDHVETGFRHRSFISPHGKHDSNYKKVPPSKARPNISWPMDDKPLNGALPMWAPKLKANGIGASPPSGSNLHGQDASTRSPITVPKILETQTEYVEVLPSVSVELLDRLHIGQQQGY